MIAAFVRSPTGRALALAVLAVVCLALQQHLVDIAAALQHAADVHEAGRRPLGPDFSRSLPYPVVDEVFGPPQSIHIALAALGALEALVLYGLYRALRGRAVGVAERAGVAVAALAMIAIALRAHAVTSFDLYAYAGYAKLGGMHAAYAPPGARLTGEFGAINDVWGTPLVASYYGPLWVGLSQLVAGHASGLGDAVFTFRLIELLPFAIVFATVLRRMGFALAAVFALDPAMHELFIANGHNDLLAVALVLVALGSARSLPLLAAVLVACAGLVKLPLIACATLVFAGRDAPLRRASYAVLAVGLCVSASLAFGGVDYVRDLVFRLHQVNEHASALNALTAKGLRAALLAVAVSALVAAFVRGIVWRTASWSFLSLSTVVWPWYLAWSFPYAALERVALAQYLILFPLAAAALDNAFPHLGFGQAAMLVMLAAVCYEIARRKPAPIEPALEPAR